MVDINELVKLQLLSSPKQVSLKTIKYLVAATLIEEGVKHVGTICTAIQNRFRRKVKETIKSHAPLSKDSILLGTKHTFNKVSMKRDWKTTQESFQETNIMVDAVLNVISKLDNVPRLQLIENAHSLVNYREKPFQVTKDIFAKVESIVTDPETGITASVELSLVSNSLSSSEILKWVRQVYALYKEQIKNSLGDTLYFFDQKNRDSGDPRGNPPGLDENMKSLQRAVKISTAPKQLTFLKSPFYSNKSFRNIFGREVREVEERVRFFLEHRDWYDQRGIPYQLGLLLSGIPGSGKTSIIRAMANLTKRHIINVNFANISTATQLKNLFFNEKITVYTDSTMTNYDILTIPIENRIFVLEEIDAIGNIVRQRDPHEKSEGETFPDELTLAEILTVLDGTLESPGRIVIMTSNHPEVLDKALIRPGRIDVSVKFGFASRELTEEMYKCFFGKEFPRSIYEKVPDQVLTAAEVGQVLFRNFKDPRPQLVLEDLLRTSDKRGVPDSTPIDGICMFPFPWKKLPPPVPDPVDPPLNPDELFEKQVQRGDLSVKKKVHDPSSFPRGKPKDWDGPQNMDIEPMGSSSGSYAAF
jgi:hypothetical protein